MAIKVAYPSAPRATHLHLGASHEPSSLLPQKHQEVLFSWSPQSGLGSREVDCPQPFVSQMGQVWDLSAELSFCDFTRRSTPASGKCWWAHLEGLKAWPMACLSLIHICKCTYTHTHVHMQAHVNMPTSQWVSNWQFAPVSWSRGEMTSKINRPPIYMWPFSLSHGNSLWFLAHRYHSVNIRVKWIKVSRSIHHGTSCPFPQRTWVCPD